MVQSDLTIELDSEAQLADFAGEVATRWHADPALGITLGLRGDLGAGKTTWVRGMLRGLGHRGRVPSPTFTLLEQYGVGARAILHLDLYRLGDAEEVENLGVRDWLAEPGAWLLIEWPERAPGLLERCDVLLTLEFTGPGARRAVFSASTPSGRKALHHLAEAVPSKIL